MSYIKSGSMCKLLLSPKVFITAEMKDLLDKIDLLESEYDLSRGIYRKPLNDHQRMLLKEMAPIKKQYWLLFAQYNQAYIDHWGIQINE